MVRATVPAAAALPIAEPGTADQFEAYYETRWRLLRAPWGQARGSERDAHDAHATHLMVCAPDAAVVAVARLHGRGGARAQVRYMAVDPAWQGQGLGRRLLQALETRALSRGIVLVVLDAREGAVGFYERCGYRVTRAAHTLYGSIQHWHMEKRLPCAPAESHPE